MYQARQVRRGRRDRRAFRASKAHPVVPGLPDRLDVPDSRGSKDHRVLPVPRALRVYRERVQQAQPVLLVVAPA